MIDCGKLKEAEYLLKKISIKNPTNLGFKYLNGEMQLYFYHANDKQIYTYNSWENLIAKLKELTKPEPKYNEGTHVYWTYNNHIYTGMTDAVCNAKGGYRYQIDCDNNTINLHEEQLYPSREALIDAQIEYWHSMKYNTVCEAVERAEKSKSELSKVFEDNMNKYPIYGMTHCRKCKQPLWHCVNRCTCTKSQETSTGSDDVSVECDHEHTFLSGFACVKCGHNAIKDGGAECEHESDVELERKGGCIPGHFKCKKCGEFYR